MNSEGRLMNKELQEKKMRLEANIRRLEQKYHLTDRSGQRKEQEKRSILVSCKEKVQSHPIPMLVASVAAGFVAGSLLRSAGSGRKRHSKKYDKRDANRRTMAERPGLSSFISDEIKRQIAQRGVQRLVTMIEKRAAGEKNRSDEQIGKDHIR